MLRFRASAAVAVVAVAVLASVATSRAHRPLAHDAYVWQRVWTPAKAVRRRQHA